MASRRISCRKADSSTSVPGEEQPRIIEVGNGLLGIALCIKHALYERQHTAQGRIKRARVRLFEQRLRIRRAALTVGESAPQDAPVDEIRGVAVGDDTQHAGIASAQHEIGRRANIANIVPNGRRQRNELNPEVAHEVLLKLVRRCTSVSDLILALSVATA